MQVLVRSRLLSERGFAHGFSTRQGGVSRAPFESLNLGRSVGDSPDHVQVNLRRFAAAVGYAPEALFELNQVHGARARRLTPLDTPDAVRTEDGDGLMAGKGFAVGVRTADCLPLLVADPVTRSAAALHAGWRGCVAGIVKAGVDGLCALTGAVPERLVVGLFPHIRSCCFEVGQEVAEALAAVAQGTTVIERGPGNPHVALVSVARAQLMAAGVRAEHIDDVPGCTYCEPERFFSFRRDGKDSGRHLAAIVAA